MRSTIGFRLGSRQAQKASGFIGHVVEIDQAATFADHVEQVAVLAGCRVSPFAGRAAARIDAFQAHEHRAAGRVPDVADLPIIADATSVGEIVTAHRLGLAREAMCQLSRIARHVTLPPDRRHAQSDSTPEPWRGQRSAASTKQSRRIGRRCAADPASCRRSQSTRCGSHPSRGHA